MASTTYLCVQTPCPARRCIKPRPSGARDKKLNTEQSQYRHTGTKVSLEVCIPGRIMQTSLLPRQTGKHSNNVANVPCFPTCLARNPNATFLLCPAPSFCSLLLVLNNKSVLELEVFSTTRLPVLFALPHLKGMPYKVSGDPHLHTTSAHLIKRASLIRKYSPKLLHLLPRSNHQISRHFSGAPATVRISWADCSSSIQIAHWCELKVSSKLQSFAFIVQREHALVMDPHCV